MLNYLEFYGYFSRFRSLGCECDIPSIYFGSTGSRREYQNIYIFQNFIFILGLRLSQVFISKVGKKGAVYIPKRICERLGISEEDKVLMRVEGGKLVLEFIPDPLSLAVKIKK
ncbi:MAG: AbrB/MazE/SpoVT family DNA-binding domain-containing protein, partial [Candidatus Bathyarchaeia archaeon]